MPNKIKINQLDELTKIYLSDKGSFYKCSHKYTIYYEKIFNLLYNVKNIDKINLLEIGLNRDNQKDIPSLKLWNDYLNNNCNIFGFDIYDEFLKFNGLYDNIKIYCGDQSNKNDLIQLKENYYNIIIDDGYHASKHQQISFKELWNNILPGGIYIIEDLHWQPENEKGIKTKELLLEWKNDNYIQTEYITLQEVNNIKKNIEKIEFYDSKSKIWNKNDLKNAIVFIYKKN